MKNSLQDGRMKAASTPTTAKPARPKQSLFVALSFNCLQVLTPCLYEGTVLVDMAEDKLVSCLYNPSSIIIFLSLSHSSLQYYIADLRRWRPLPRPSFDHESTLTFPSTLSPHPQRSSIVPAPVWNGASYIL